MADKQDHERVWELMGEIGVCMLVTQDAGGIRARPMAAHVDEQGNAVRFLTNRRHHKIDEIQADSTVCMTFADARKHHASVTGRAAVSQVPA